MDTGNSSRIPFPPDNPSAPTLAQDQLHAAILAWTLELAPHGLFTTDAELKITSWNQWLETHTRKKAEAVLGKPLVEVIPSLVERRLDHYYRDALQGESKVLSRSLHGYLLPLPPTVPTPQFAHMQQSARIAPLLLQGRIAGTITVIEDVTEREWQHAVLRQARQRSELLASTLAQAQAELAEHAASLEKTVKERTRELRETISQLESFSYTVAHDLRAPIRTFENYAKILLEDYGARLDAQAQTLLVNMARAARRLDALTKDVLNYTKVATQKAELASVDPAEILQDVLVMNPALQMPNAEVAVARPLPRVLAHPTLLSQCFSNLLSNAVKFVQPGLTPHIVIRSETRSSPAPAKPVSNLLRPSFGHEAVAPEPAAEVGSSPDLARPRVRLWVQDNGIGIDPGAQAKVFGIFERGRGASKIPGTGIGLAIVAKAVERMEGACGVESHPGEGSRFWIELLAA